MGSRLADLVFDPTLACRGVRRLCGGLAPSPGRGSPRRRQGLHLSRTMLSDQRSPYVGRFACDWHRLPGEALPGNHRPRPESQRIIATGRDRAPQRPGGREYAHLACPRREEGSGAVRRGGPGGDHVVHQDDPVGRVRPRPKRPGERPAPFLAGTPGLRPRLDSPRKQRSDWPPGQGGDRLGQRFGLVVAAGAFASSAQGDPRENGSLRRWPRRREVRQRLDHGWSHRLRHGAQPGELQPEQCPADRALVEERRPTPANRWWGAIRTCWSRHLGRPAAPAASGRRERDHPAPTVSTPRRPAASATDAGAGEQERQDASEHSPKLSAATDTLGPKFRPARWRRAWTRRPSGAAPLPPRTEWTGAWDRTLIAARPRLGGRTAEILPPAGAARGRRRRR
jgi:hypothetical protein